MSSPDLIGLLSCLRLAGLNLSLSFRHSKNLMNIKLTLRGLLIASAMTLNSCGFQSKSLQITEELETVSECRNFRSLFWQTLHQASLDEKNPSSWEELEQGLKNSKDLRLQEWLGIIKILKTSLNDSFWQLPVSEQVEIWGQLELGLDIRPGFSEIIQNIKQTEGQFRQLGTKDCRDEEELRPPRDIETASLKDGMRRLLAGAYQSCEATQLSSLDESSARLEGVIEVGTHADGIGKVRKIGNLELVQSTHPYLRVQNRESDCFAVMEKPLIYDYGGKPAYPTAKGRVIDLFKNAGSGSTVLGIDCSALVVSSLGLSGFRLKPNEPLTASQTAAFGTATLIQSPKYFPCLDYIAVGKNQNLMSGDIITVQGHTVIVDSVGQDPWGIEGIQNENSCLALDGSKFDFVVFHSSPLYGATGIQKTQARAYMRENSRMTRGFLKYAKEHCLSNLQQQTRKPIWSDVSIVRHKKTPECLGVPLQMEKQACVKSCW